MIFSLGGCNLNIFDGIRQSHGDFDNTFIIVVRYFFYFPEQVDFLGNGQVADSIYDSVVVRRNRFIELFDVFDFYFASCCNGSGRAGCMEHGFQTQIFTIGITCLFSFENPDAHSHDDNY